MFLRFAIEVRKGGKVGAALLREVMYSRGYLALKARRISPPPTILVEPPAPREREWSAALP